MEKWTRGDILFHDWIKIEDLLLKQGYVLFNE